MPAFNIAKKFTELAAPDINLALTSTFKKLLAPIRKEMPKTLDVFIGYWDTIPQKLQSEYIALRSSGLKTDDVYLARDMRQTFHAFFYNKQLHNDAPEVIATGRGVPLNPYCRTMFRNEDGYINYRVEDTESKLLQLSLGSWALDFAQYSNSMVHPNPGNSPFSASLLTLLQQQHFVEAGGVYVADAMRGQNLGEKMGMTLRTVIRHGLDSSTFAGVNQAFWKSSTKATLKTYPHSVTTLETPMRKGTNVRLIIGTENNDLYKFLMTSENFQDLSMFAKQKFNITV